jgi:hypothetical protein
MSESRVHNKNVNKARRKVTPKIRLHHIKVNNLAFISLIFWSTAFNSHAKWDIIEHAWDTK